jgi:hypothetical protein
MSILRKLSFVLLLLTLALSMTMPAQAFIKQPSHFVPGDDAIGAAAGDQYTPAIARGGDNFLVVWSDKRSNPNGGIYFEFETSNDIYGVRLDATGHPLEMVPFPIAAGPGSQEKPQVVWNGTNWLVVYESYDIGGTGYYYQKTLEAVRVSPAGVVLDPKPIKFYSLTPSGGVWSVASDGNNWVIAFEGTSASTDLMATRISPEGVVLDPPIHTLVPATYYSRPNLRLAFANGVFLLTWADFSDTMAIRFDPQLNLLDAAPYLLLSSWNLTDLTSNGSQYYAIWISQEPPNYLIAVTGSRISTDGVMLDGSGVDISQTHEPESYYTASVVWDGTNWKVIWGYQGVSVARINPDGQVLDPGGVTVPGLTPGPAAPSPSGGVQIVWSDFNILLANSYDVFSASISTDNVAEPIQTPSSGTPSQQRPDISVGSAGYMLVYRSDISGVHRIMAQPLDAAGTPLTTEPILLDTGDSTNGPGIPTVAWNGSLYLVSWNNSSGVVAQRIQQDGTQVDPSPIIVMPGFGPTDVAALGDVFLVTGLKIGINPQYVFPMAARVRGSDGVVLDNPALTLGDSFAAFPSVAVVGGRWLVVWESHPTHDNPIADTMAAFVDADGVHPAEFFVYGSYTTSSYTYGTSLASNGTEALVLQNAEISSGVEMDLAARIVHSDGTLGLDFNLTPWSGNQYYPRVAWDGSQFIVVYQDQRNRLAEWELDQMDAHSDLFGMRITPDGTILDPTGFIFSNSTGAEAYPNIAATDGTSLIAASIMLESPYSSYRVGYELIGAGGNAWPVAVATTTPVNGDVPLPVSFSSAGSTDMDGSIASYAWDFGDGSSSSEANPSHTYIIGGPFVATLTVTDDQGAQTTTTVFVKALNPNQLPVANASADPMGGIPPFDVVFDATGSYDPDGWLGNFHWTFSDGGEYWGNIAYATVYTSDPFTATLTVFDNRNGTGTATVVLNTGNFPPVLDPIGAKTVDELTPLVFTATATDPDVGQSLTFSLGPDAPSGASIDPLTGVFSWTPTEAQGPGTYPVKVIVTDNSGFPLSDFEIIQVTVNEVNLDPIVDAGPDQAANEGQPVHFTGSFVDPGLLGIPQAGESILWDFGDGITTTGVLTPTHSYGNNGIFTVTLTVTDTYGGAGHDSLQVSTTNISPVLEALPDRTAGPGQLITINGVFTDPGWLDTHTLTIEWAPGVTENLDLAAGVYEFQLSHTYTTLGDYTVTISVADPDGGQSSQDFIITVQLYEIFLPFTRR